MDNFDEHPAGDLERHACSSSRESLWVDFDRSTRTLRVAGELDANTAATLVATASNYDVASIDARRLEFVGAAGLTALLEIGESKPIPVAASAGLRRLIQICRLEAMLQVQD